ncbi:MAG: cysteine--tRNA ligase [Phycisphaeraceae bacterium]|nr:cysteine--tRNA ligase [Phycisphaeraceae bacterium]
MPLNLYNTLTRRVEPLTPGDPSRVTFYSCGPTVYDDAHIGNFRSFLAADVLRRFIESPLCDLATAGGGVHRGPRTVVHVMNITDVGHMTDDAEGGEHGEDRMAVAGRRLAEAKKSGKLPQGVSLDPGNPYAIAGFYAERFLDDARRLGLKVALEAQHDPTLMPRPTAKIPGMVAMIARLIERGFAYVRGEPGGRVVYFDVQRFPSYGRLSGNTLEHLRAGAGGRVSDANQQQKNHPADFLLWKEDPRHIMKWPSPWGEGYPGWHIECSVMAGERLAGADGMIDLHSGGEDNIFPHHECEIAQSCCATGAPAFSRAWFHARHLIVEGAKMSKSKGNFFTARDLFDRGVEPAALRLELIRTHYRSNANFTFQGLTDSQRLIDRWRKALESAPGGDTQAERRARDQSPVREFADAMHDDLNIAGAIAAVNALAATTGSTAAAGLRLMDGVLGVLGLERPAARQTEIGLFVGGAQPDDRVEALLRQRREARAAKDFKRSDAIRDELAAMGWQIKDAPGGRVEVSRRHG